MSTDPSTPARLLIHPPLTGAENMAIDSALLEAAAQGRSPLTLRLYAWDPPAVTIGRFQSIDTVDVDLCGSLGIDIVRRPTGGRGVLHADELTYSLVGTVEDGIPPGVERSYAFLSQALSCAFSRLGVAAQLVAGEGRASMSAACYVSGSTADLCAGAAKLSGSAQVWKSEAVLQHGCFVRSRDVEREASVFMLEGEERARLVSQTVTLEDLLDERPDVDSIISAVVASFSDLFDREFLLGSLTEEEGSAIEARLGYSRRAF